jgi:hypothetical protein
LAADNTNKFILEIGDWLKQAKEDGDKILRKVTLDMFSRVVMRSPVDTGRFRNNWYPSIGAPVSQTNEGVDPSGAKTIGKISNIAATAKMGDMIWMSNSLPYAWRLETGWSKQAPAGFVGITVLEFQSLLSRASKSTKTFG